MRPVRLLHGSTAARIWRNYRLQLDVRRLGRVLDVEARGGDTGDPEVPRLAFGVVLGVVNFPRGVGGPSDPADHAQTEPGQRDPSSRARRGRMAAHTESQFLTV